MYVTCDIKRLVNQLIYTKIHWLTRRTHSVTLKEESHRRNKIRFLYSTMTF